MTFLSLFASNLLQSFSRSNSNFSSKHKKVQIGWGELAVVWVSQLSSERAEKILEMIMLEIDCDTRAHKKLLKVQTVFSWSYTDGFFLSC